MKADIRRIWQYKGCKIIPVDCQHPTWGKSATPQDFGDGIYRNRYWRIEFPDKSWIHSATKTTCREYIDNHIEAHG